MNAPLRQWLADCPDGTRRASLADGRWVIAKRRRGVPDDFFPMQAHGLTLLREVGGLRVPVVLAVDAGGIVLKDLGTGTPSVAAWERAGAALARQHRQSAAGFGLGRDGWCGDGLQVNTPMRDGHAFFAQCRLLPQARRALDAGLLEAGDMAQVERICARLAQLVPGQPPVLLHGDLWTGNLHCAGDGELALIDAAAVHHGWAEAELAMLTLFGAPPAAFFAAYAQASGISGDWTDRAPLYNLYHLLNHLNLFGRGYLTQVRSVLAAFA